MQEQGLVLKGVGGFYTVQMDTGGEVVAKARGKFRREGISPVCGDRVCIERQADGDAALVEILPRRNLLARPAVANIDQIVIVLSVSVPKPDLLLCDKLMLTAATHHIEPLIIFNKTDTADDEVAQAFCAEYSPLYAVLTISAATGAGADALSDALESKVSCFAGQSATGKSSLLNLLMPGLNLPVGGLAKRTSRGRHTTRHAELWPYRGGAVLDTPGFSLLDPACIDQAALDTAYREFGDAPAQCRFAACSHRTEPDCAVKALVGKRLSEGRYSRYLELFAQIEEMRKHTYD